MFGERAEKIASYLTKGKPVICSGEHVQSVWTDKETGKERRRFELKVFSLTFQRGDRDGQKTEQAQPENTNYDRAQAQVAAQGKGDDIPF
jgi:single-stranded DNA-binding protein